MLVMKCVLLNCRMMSERESIRLCTIVCDIRDVEATCTVHVVGFEIDPEAA